MTKSYFITGTDTKVGKTIVSAALLRSAQQLGYITVGYKPVASGGSWSSEGLRNRDVLILQNNGSLLLDYKEVNSYTFVEPTSPHIASFNENKLIDFNILSAKLYALKYKADCIIVEGAGGWLTPLSKQQTLADWVLLEQLPIILVVGIKLGCINHAILTYRAIAQSNLRLVGWVANNVVQPNKYNNEYVSTLKYLLPAPMLGIIPWNTENKMTYIDISRFLNFSLLLSDISCNK